MLYLVIEILAFVILAGLLGLVCGWLIRGGDETGAKHRLAALQAEIDNKNEALYQVRSQLAAAKDLLRERVGPALDGAADGDSRSGSGGDSGADPRLVALLTGRYRRPARDNGAAGAQAPESVAGAAKSNGNGALPLGRRLGKARTIRRPPRPRGRRARRAAAAGRGRLGARVR